MKRGYPKERAKPSEKTVCPFCLRAIEFIEGKAKCTHCNVAVQIWLLSFVTPPWLRR